MGCLKEPEIRKKYSKDELLDLITTYENIEEEINKLEY
jgi:hypothetical protein